MPNDKRDVLDVLKFELNFIEQGGYGRSVRTPWKPTSIFEDSVSCLNFGDPGKTHPCQECHLMQFVPPEHRGQTVPCHSIPLDSAGETVENLRVRGDQARLEEAVAGWLRATIRKLERATPAGAPGTSEPAGVRRD